MEECAEVQKECAKALRFGLNEYYGPIGTETNKESIDREFDDLVGVIRLLRREKFLGPGNPEDQIAKMVKIEKYLEYSKIVGTLD